MSVTTHVFPYWIANHNAANLATDTYKVLLVASTSPALTWNSTLQAVSAVSGAAGTGFLGGSGAGALTEVSTSGTGYSRVTLSGLSVVQTTGGTAYTTLKCTGTVAWPSSTISATYACFYDYTLGGNSDTAGVPVCYWDFGGTQATSSATFTLTLGTSTGTVPTALVEWTDN
jgi:hypothetical protein